MLNIGAPLARLSDFHKKSYKRAEPLIVVFYYSYSSFLLPDLKANLCSDAIGQRAALNILTRLSDYKKRQAPVEEGDLPSN